MEREGAPGRCEVGAGGFDCRLRARRPQYDGIQGGMPARHTNRILYVLFQRFSSPSEYGVHIQREGITIMPRKYNLPTQVHVKNHGTPYEQYHARIYLQRGLFDTVYPYIDSPNFYAADFDTKEGAIAAAVRARDALRREHAAKLPATTTKPSDWTPQEDAKLIRLVESGASPAELLVALAPRSGYSIQNRMKRLLGFSFSFSQTSERKAGGLQHLQTLRTHKDICAAHGAMDEGTPICRHELESMDNFQHRWLDTVGARGRARRDEQ